MAKLTLLFAFACLASLASSQCAKPTPRSEIRSLPPDQRALFFSALEKIRNNGELDRLSKLHVDNANTIHGRPVFLAFHRLFVHDFAQAIQKAEPGAPVPYWDWSLDATNPIRSDVFTNDYLGGNGSGDQSCVQSGRFANWQMMVEKPHCLARKFNNGAEILPFWPPDALLVMQKNCKQYGALGSGVENGCHGAVHIGISGDMSTMFAPNDPFFFLHHGMVDKIWYDWQLMEPATRFQMYDGVNYKDSAVSADDIIPGYPGVRVRDVLDPRTSLCYEYIDSGSHAAAKKLMQEVDKQAEYEKKKASNGGSSASNAPAPQAPPSAPAHASSAPQDSVEAAAKAAGNGTPSASDIAALKDITTQVSHLSGDDGTKAEAQKALHKQQVDFLKQKLVDGFAGNNVPDIAAFLGGKRRFVRRRLALREIKEESGLGLDGLVTGLVGGLLGKEGLVTHLVQGLTNVVSVLPQGLGETLKAVGGIAEHVTDDVFNILHLPKVDLSKLTAEERRIPYVAELPDWWYERNNLNATYAAELRTQIHDIIDGLNSIPGYVSPAVVQYAAKKYCDK
ncbi:hypothetical protein GGI12_000688 [Dipsacomyces acuminosporus]|nr:hypothetical protein GGI12_000688 [Dipsacomyces acuminosporus]